MTDKDPKDMTASELLRATADSIREGVNCRGTRFTSGDSIDELRKMLDLDPRLTYADDMVCALSNLSDKIYAEMAESKESGLNTSLRYGAELWAKANGWPDFREGEDFSAWLDRCFIPRPRFEDGEPVHIGDKAEHPYTGETCTIDCINTFDDSYCLGFVEERSASLCDGERVKRPAHEVLGADGKPIKVGETVYPIDGEWLRIPLEVSGIESPASVKVYLSAGKSWTTFHADRLTHTPPDTQEKIDADKNLMWTIYWDCTKRDCLGCDVLHGKSPSEYYNVHNCSVAQGLDIARRQAELDKRAGGAE